MVKMDLDLMPVLAVRNITLIRYPPMVMITMERLVVSLEVVVREIIGVIKVSLHVPILLRFPQSTSIKMEMRLQTVNS